MLKTTDRTLRNGTKFPTEIEKRDLPLLGWVTIELGEENAYFTRVSDGAVFFCKQAELECS